MSCICKRTAMIWVQRQRFPCPHGVRIISKQHTSPGQRNIQFPACTLRACLEVLAGERSYSYTLDRRTVLLYLGSSSSSTEHAASGGTHMEWELKTGCRYPDPTNMSRCCPWAGARRQVCSDAGLSRMWLQRVNISHLTSWYKLTT